MAKICQIDIYYWVLLIIFPKYCVTNDYTCSKKSECLCEFKNKNVLDITLIHGSFKRNDLSYEFSGCNKKVLNKTGCENAMLCRYNETNQKGEDLGDSLNFVSLNGIGEHNISFSVKNVNTSIIKLICTNGSNSTVFIDQPGSDDFYIFSPHGCVLYYHASEGLSTGSVLILLLFIGCVFYFVGGAIILHCIRGARGKEMIPNIDFWQNLPSLVKDGLIFVLNGCRPTAISTAESYDRI